MRPLIVLGAAGLAREIAMIAHAANQRNRTWSKISFVSGDASEVGTNLGYGEVIGDDAWLLGSKIEADLVAGIGYPRVRSRVLEEYLLQRDRFAFPNLIHPTASMDVDRMTFGEGNVVTAGCALTCDIAIGDFNLFNLNGTVGHDARIGRFNVLNPSVNVSGGVTLGDRVLVGTGAQILENIRIGSDATVGAGAVVRADVPPGVTVVGVPAKPLAR